MHALQVTVLMPTFNGSKTIARSIASIQRQDFSDWNLLVLIDASTDDTLAVVKPLADQDRRIQIIVNESNLRLSKTLNRGISLAASKYLVRLDDDDIWSDRGKLGNQIQFLKENPKYSLIGTGFRVLDEEGSELRRSDMQSDDMQIRQRLLSENPFCHSSVIFKKSDAEKVGLYNPRLGYTEDWDLWLRLGMVGKLFIIGGVGVDYLSKEGMSKQNKKSAQIRFHMRLLGKYAFAYPGKIQAMTTLLKYAICG